MSTAARLSESAATVELGMERNVLGAIFVQNGVLHTVAPLIDADDFYSTDHAKIFAAMLEMDSGIDPRTVLNAVQRRGQRVSLSAAELSETTLGTLPGSAPRYAAAVREASLRRRAVALCERTTLYFQDPSQSLLDSLKAAHEGFLELVSGSQDHPTLHAFQVADPVLCQIAARRKRDDRMVGLPFGLDVLDETTSGVSKGELVLIAARPGVGKTSLLVQTTRVNAQAGRGVFVFSAEMTKEQFFSRMLSQVSRIPSFKIRRAWLLTDEEEKQLARSAAEIAGWPWYIADRSNPHITEVVSRAVAAVKHRKCELIALDHIQKFRADGDNETERTSAISAALAQLAKDYAPVVALSQLTKPADHSKAKWPTALDLRGSGMLEADAHTIVLLHRDLDQGGQYASKGYAIVEKQREGMTGVLNVHFDTDLLRFIRA